MADYKRYLGQFCLYALFFVPLVIVTQSPQHRHLEPGFAELKLAVRHPGKIIGECVPLQGAEYENRASNMKVPELCPRERSPLQLELILDGQTLYEASVPASGLHEDGVASIYRRFKVPAGPHDIELRINDDVAVEGPTWVLQERIELQPAQILAATFKEGFELK